MRIIALCIAGCIAIAALRLALAFVAMLAVAALLWLLFFKPVEVLSFIAVCAVLRLVETHPLLVAGSVVAIMFAARSTDIDRREP